MRIAYKKNSTIVVLSLNSSNRQFACTCGNFFAIMAKILFQSNSLIEEHFVRKMQVANNVLDHNSLKQVSCLYKEKT